MSYEYDSVGNRTKRTDYLNQVTDYTYDNLNRLTNITYPDATENVTLVYDNTSRLTKATKNAQDVTFVYDKRNRPTSTTDVHGKIVAMVYDATSNRTALKLGGVNFSTYVYDVVNRLTKITNSADAKAVNYLYDNANRMTKETLPNGIASTFAYDGMSRLTEINDKKGATTLFDRDYSYNTASQISQIAELAQTRNFNYDTLDRLTSVSGSTTEAYGFDSVGNRTSSHLSAGYSYQPNNRLSNTATSSYVYNSNGNMVSKADSNSTTQYVWDFENRLKQVILPNAQIVNYKYDALGRRSERNVNTTTWTKFTYDGLDVMLDQNSDGSQVTYLNGLGIDNKLRQTVNGQAQYFLNDHLGSTNALTDATGTVIASTTYDSFGNASNASIGTRYQFTGREFDSLTGLQYSRARFYSPELGRFISEDPIGFAGGDANLYGYVRNQPFIYRDALGLFPGADVMNPNILGPLGGAIAGAGVAGSAAGAVAAAAGPVALGGLAIGGGIAVGIYTAGHPSNPFVNGSLNPFGTPASMIPLTPLLPGASFCPLPKTATMNNPLSNPFEQVLPIAAAMAAAIATQNTGDKGRCNPTPLTPKPVFIGGLRVCSYYCAKGTLPLNNAQFDGKVWYCPQLK